jgi:acetylglutamate kinase
MKIIVIKIGGNALHEKNIQSFTKDIARLQKESAVVLIHGGGDEVSSLSKQLGFEPHFLGGVRMTGMQEMDVVEMVLSGKVNRHLVRAFNRAGIISVGLSGQDGILFEGVPIDASGTRTGKVENCDVRLLKLLLSENYLPIISPVSFAKDGGALNINADEVATAIAACLRAVSLIFVSDIQGVLNKGEILVKMNEKEITKEIEQGTISGGMVVKVQSALRGLRNGIEKITIGEYRNRGDMLLLFEGTWGTVITTLCKLKKEGQ